MLKFVKLYLIFKVIGAFYALSSSAVKIEPSFEWTGGGI